LPCCCCCCPIFFLPGLSISTAIGSRWMSTHSRVFRRSFDPRHSRLIALLGAPLLKQQQPKDTRASLSLFSTVYIYVQGQREIQDKREVLLILYTKADSLSRIGEPWCIQMQRGR
jgi:hypothetical protein